MPASALSGHDVGRVALLNDDAVPAPGWLGTLEAALDADPTLAAVQGTVTDATGAAVDGRGIALDDVALPVQIDRGSSPAPEPARPRPVIAVSGHRIAVSDPGAPRNRSSPTAPSSTPVSAAITRTSISASE